VHASWITAKVKPEERERFLEAIETCAIGSERDEPGCVRYNVLQDLEDENTYYFYMVFKDDASREQHQQMPHYQPWAAAADTLQGPVEPTRTRSVFPSDPEYWEKNQQYWDATSQAG
jgi:autoinducer 2-degrading protein